jgi:hypothetical protein
MNGNIFKIAILIILKFGTNIFCMDNLIKVNELFK